MVKNNEENNGQRTVEDAKENGGITIWYITVFSGGTDANYGNSYSLYSLYDMTFEPGTSAKPIRSTTQQIGSLYINP